jgi:hypothetical protein
MSISSNFPFGTVQTLLADAAANHAGAEPAHRIPPLSRCCPRRISSGQSGLRPSCSGTTAREPMRPSRAAAGGMRSRCSALRLPRRLLQRAPTGAHLFSHDHSPDPAYDAGIRGHSSREASRRVMDASAGGRVIDMRSLVMMFAGLVIGGAAIATTAGCTPAASAGQPYGCAAGVPWVPDGYTNGKFVPAHCLGQPAQ